MIPGNQKRIPETKEVLQNHLLAQIKSLKDLDGSPSADCQTSREEILDAVVQGLTNEDIIDLLKNENHLRKRIHEVLSKRLPDDNIISSKEFDDGSSTYDKEEIGEQLFQKVARLDSQLCAQITGMLLEMDTSALNRMITNDKELSEAVKKARTEYLQYIKSEACIDIPSCPPAATMTDTTTESSDSSPSEEKEVLGERLYDLLLEKCPEHASKITGMLLELDVASLQKLMLCPEKLQEKVDVAVQALTTSEGSARDS